MLVDDEPALRTVGRAILSTLDVRVITASSGEDALALLADAHKDAALPNVMLLDLTLPGGMSGLETFELIKALYPTLPVIACSGFFGDGASEIIQHVGFADMLAKPYTPDALITMVRRVLMRVNGEA
jgi:CheY-like chemotaxis protein